jgi:hypothetical protein
MNPKAADWYPDPSGDFKYRYWNGQKWTEHVSNGGTASADAGWPRAGSTAPAPVSNETSGPTFDDPEDATRWKMVHAVRFSIDQMMDKYQECFEKAELTEKAYAMANTEYVNGVRQHELSKKSFAEMGARTEGELVGLLAELRTATLTAENQWKDLLFLLPGSGNDVVKISSWCMSHGVGSDVVGSVIGNGMFIHTDFGSTRQSFWTENERVASVLSQSGQ